jgi:uncharacterized protein (DUF849 family)
LLIKACLNGGSDHPAAPVTPAELARDARAVVAAGAEAIHIHPRSASGEQSLDAADVLPAVAAIRAAVPGVPIGVTTGIWAVDGDPSRRLGLVSAWDGPDMPDFASVNMNEEGIIPLAALLSARGIGVEAGVWLPEEVDTLAASGFADSVLRVLIEPEESSGSGAVATVVAVETALDRRGISAPTVAHGYDLATWEVIRRCIALDRGFRIGLEDTAVLPDGSPAAGNADLVAAAVALVRSGPVGSSGPEAVLLLRLHGPVV